MIRANKGLLALTLALSIAVAIAIAFLEGKTVSAQAAGFVVGYRCDTIDNGNRMCKFKDSDNDSTCYVIESYWDVDGPYCFPPVDKDHAGDLYLPVQLLDRIEAILDRMEAQ